MNPDGKCIKQKLLAFDPLWSFSGAGGSLMKTMKERWHRVTYQCFPKFCPSHITTTFLPYQHHGIVILEILCFKFSHLHLNYYIQKYPLYHEGIPLFHEWNANLTCHEVKEIKQVGM